MQIRHLLAFVTVFLAGVARARGGEGSAPGPEQSEFFEKKVRPILVQHCYPCHSRAKHKGNLVLEDRAGLLKGGDSGPAVMAGHAARSLLIKAIGYQDTELRMPPRGKLTDDQIESLRTWVESGAAWPGPGAGHSSRDIVPKSIRERRAKLWSLQPLTHPVLPKVKDSAWPRTPVDRFVLAELESRGMRPAAEADKRTLLRRLTFDLVGLPPTPAEIEAFLADSSPDTYERVVERLLASPHYGERWARHWLDLVRFAETAGHEFDFNLYDAYAYRDYVVRAFNADLPYDQLVLEHLAGDLLPFARRDPARGSNESAIATGFFFLGEAKHSPVDIRADSDERIDNQIDVLTKTFEGLTVACARCHDHKFDPISTRDYYALSGILRSSRYQEAVIDPPEKLRKTIQELRDVQAKARPLAVAFTVNALREGARHFSHRLLATLETDDKHIEPSDREAVDRLKDALKAIRPTDLDHPLYAWRSNEGREARGKGRASREAVSTRQAGLNSDSFRDWFVTGDAFGAGPSKADDVLLRPDGRVSRLIGPGLAHSGLVSGRLQGVLRSRTFTIEKKNIVYRVAGRGARINLIIDGFQQIRDPIYGGLTFSIDGGDRPRWHVQDVSMWLGHRAYVEILDQGDGYVAVEKVLFSDAGAPPAEPNRLVSELVKGHTFKELAGSYEKLFLDVIEDWQAGKDLDAERVALFNWMIESKLFEGDHRDAGPELQALLAQCRRIEAGIARPKRAMAMADGTGENDHVHVRGNPNKFGEEVPRRFLEVVAGPGESSPAPGSGRLDLARCMISPSNPLLPRVMVNRIWQHHFGEGIVRSPDNFGFLGRSPSHPELLDYLAGEFVRHDWSIKDMHRLMVLSAAYRMASRSEPQADTLDPENEWLHRMPVRRLEAECIRDAILAVSGELDPKLFGPSVPPHLTPFMAGRGRPTHSGPLDGDRRRTLYIAVRRNFLTPMLTAFDYPTPFTTIGRRSVSNVPAQALALLNNPFVVEQAGHWAQRILTESNLTDEQRIERMYVAAFGRPPAPEELADTLGFLRGEGESPRAWADLCHVLINVKEFIFIN